jgi:hypothetical protein
MKPNVTSKDPCHYSKEIYDHLIPWRIERSGNTAISPTRTEATIEYNTKLQLRRLMCEVCTGFGVRFSAEAGDISLLHSVQTGFGVHPAS